jgi:multisubunit Na+/H+ antiporter MnhE subunit
MIRPLPLLGLVAVYALTLGSLAPGDLAIGAAVGVAVLALTRRFLEPAPGTPPMTLWRLRHLPRFAWAVLGEIAAGTWMVTMVVLGVRDFVPGIVAVPLGERSETGVAVTALAINLSPGELLVDVDWGRELMFVHVLDAHDPDDVRSRYAAFYDRYQRPLFP